MRIFETIVVAFSLFSALPMPKVDWNAENRKYSLCAFPLIGAVIGLCCWAWMRLCLRLGIPSMLRGAVLSIRSMEYVEAARSIRASDARIIFKHIIPNVLAPVIVTMTMSVAGAMLMAASLSFIGLGVQPPSPEWGAMLSAARSELRKYPYMAIAPGLVIFMTTLALNLIGDGLRDALDPRLKN